MPDNAPTCVSRVLAYGRGSSGRPLSPAFIQYPVLVIKTVRPFSSAFLPPPPAKRGGEGSLILTLTASRHRSLVTLIPSDLQQQQQQPPPLPAPGSNKSASLHVPAPSPSSIPPPPTPRSLSPKSMHPRAPFPSLDPHPIHPRTRACVSPRFALLDHVRMSSPTALTRFTLESLLCRGTRRRNTRARAYSVSRNY